MNKEFKIGDLVIFEMHKGDSQIPSGTVGVVEAIYKDACKINFIELDLMQILALPGKLKTSHKQFFMRRFYKKGVLVTCTAKQKGEYGTFPG